MDPTANTAPSFLFGDGMVTTDFGGRSDVAQGAALQPDGKILLAGYSIGTPDRAFALARYNADGGLDTSFGAGGTVLADLGGSYESGQSIALQADGKILLAGSISIDGKSQFALVCFNADGSLDTSFGGGGLVTTALGSSGARSLTLQADGKILVAGYGYIGSNSDFALARYNTDGSLDTSFGISGTRTTALTASYDDAFAVTVQADGRILVTGRSDGMLALVRYTANGALDTTFSGDGKLTTSLGFSGSGQGNSVLAQADGKIIVAGTGNGSYGDVALVRYNADGSLDASFSGDGLVTTRVGSYSDSASGQSLALQADGKIIVGGYVSSSSYTNGQFLVVRYNTDGSLDTSFGGGDGIVTTTISDGRNNSHGYRVMVQPDGKILLAGVSFDGKGDTDFALARYNADGSLDPTFDPVTSLDATPTFAENGDAVVLDGNVHISDAGLEAVGHYAGATLTLTRHGGSQAEDQFSSTGSVSALLDGSALIVSLQIIGGVTKNAGGELILSFNANATQARVNQVLQSLAYRNASDAPPQQVQIDWTFSDGNTSGAQGTGGALSITGSTTVQVTAVNDVPTVTAPAAITFTDTPGEDSFAVSSGTVAASDPDGDTLTYGIQGGTVSGDYASQAGTYGTLRVNIHNGAYRFTPDDAAIEGLKADATETFTVTATDPDGETGSASLVLNLLGSDGPTTFEGDLVGQTRVDGSDQIVGKLHVVDRDAADVAVQAQGGTLGRYGNFAVDALGRWTYALDKQIAQVQALTLGQSLTDTFTVVTASGIEQQITLTIQGADNQAPVFAASYGYLTTAFGTGHDTAYSVTLQRDGKILVAGQSDNGSNTDFALARYNADGSLDTTFSGDGKLTTAIGSFNDDGRSVVVQPDGKILVGGYARIGANTSGYEDYALVRYNADGTLDTSFSGDGKVTTDIGGSIDKAVSMALQADGKIILTGESISGGNVDFSLVRYNADGSLDTAFSGDGKVITSMFAGHESGTSVTVQADGKILQAGYVSADSGEFGLARYHADGSLDETFGTGGKILTDFDWTWDFAWGVTLQPDGKILVAGQSGRNSNNSDFALARYHADGSLDSTFGTDGKVTTHFDTGSAVAFCLALQPDGKILAAGRGGNQPFALVRYNSDGSLDTSFSGDGMVDRDLAQGFGNIASITVQDNGQILVAGTRYDYGTSTYQFALARFNADGTFDRSFGTLNTLDAAASYEENAAAVILDGNVRLHDANLYALGSYAGSSLTLARHGGAHAQDLFSGAGIVAGQASGSVTVDSATIGAYAYSAGALVISFGSAATQALVNTALQSIAYRNNSDTPPAAVQIDWTFNDGNTGAQGSGGAQSITGSSRVVISAVNDAPQGSDTRLDNAPGTRVTLSAADFGFTDAEDGTTLSAVRIDSLPTLGKLYFDGYWVTTAGAGLTFTSADLSAGRLSYQPGTSAGKLTFSVRDSEGTFDLSPHTLTLRIQSSQSTGVTVLTDGSLALVERATAQESGHSETLSFSLTRQPAHNVLVYLEQSAANPLNLSSSVLTFTPENYAIVQRVSVTAAPDALTEGAHSAQLSFRVTSADATYDDLAVSAQTFALSDPVNHPVSGGVRFWKGSGAPIPDVALEAGGQTATTDATGAFALNGVSPASGSTEFTLSASKPVTATRASEAGINLSDVLAALKVYLNKPLATDINGYTKFIAADFDANGTVNLTDVLTLLKYYLNKPTGSVVPQWVFLEAPADGTAPLNLAGAPIVKDFGSLTDDIQVVGVLRGDVDGSWVPG